jgi:hypothetical protein
MRLLAQAPVLPSHLVVRSLAENFARLIAVKLARLADLRLAAVASPVETSSSK